MQVIFYRLLKNKVSRSSFGLHLGYVTHKTVVIQGNHEQPACLFNYSCRFRLLCVSQNTTLIKLTT
jgi:hypothetical protein